MKRVGKVPPPILYSSSVSSSTSHDPSNERDMTKIETSSQEKTCNSIAISSEEYQPPPTQHTGWQRLLDSDFYPEITIRRTVFFFIWTIPHIIICSYNGATGKGDLPSNMNTTSKQCIMFDMAAILVFMSPTFLMLLRRVVVPRWITIEKNTHAHKVASYTMLFWSAIHIGVKYNQYFNQASSHINWTGKKAEGMSAIYQLFHKWTGWTGHVLMFSLFLISVTSIKLIRQRFYEFFYYAHHLFVAYIVFLFLHNKNRQAYMYLSGPLALYCVDRLYRCLRSAFALSPIRAVIQHPNGVVEMQLDKKIFGHRPGQSVKVYCPSVSPLQWHPMTISSAPEEEMLSIHFRLSGNWTRRLAKRLGCKFRNIQEARQSTIHSVVADHGGLLKFGQSQETVRPHLKIPYHPLHHDPATVPMYSNVGGNSSYVSIDMVSKGGGQKINSLVATCQDPDASTIESGDVVIKLGVEMPVLFIDGPYTTPMEHFFDYQVSVLIAAGIGVTPAAAVLRSVYFKWLHSRKDLVTKKVYLIWVYRDLYTLEWFKDLLIALQEEGMDGIVEVRTYFTGVVPPTSPTIQTPAGDAFGDRVVDTSIGTTSYVGRPNFATIFDAIGELHTTTRLGAFVCGPKPLTRQARRAAHKHKSTKIDFFSEVF